MDIVSAEKSKEGWGKMDVKKRVQGEAMGFYLDGEMLKAAGLDTAEEYLVVFGTGAIVVTDGREERLQETIIDLWCMMAEAERDQVLDLLTAANKLIKEKCGRA